MSSRAIFVHTRCHVVSILVHQLANDFQEKQFLALRVAIVARTTASSPREYPKGKEAPANHIEEWTRKRAHSVTKLFPVGITRLTSVLPGQTLVDIRLNTRVRLKVLIRSFRITKKLSKPCIAVLLGKSSKTG
jgi:hypothetical protein